jgi:photosystem II stability/assembly factor-like uncharacterized protein
MSDNLGTGVSYVNEAAGYNYDMVVFQKGKPPLDSEMNLAQQMQTVISQRQQATLPSGWMTMRNFYTSSMLKNSFYTQSPDMAIPEYALVNGMVVLVTNTGTSEQNCNLINMGTAPTSGNRVNGIFLEVWRALLSPSSSTNKPDPSSVIDSILDIDAVDVNTAWSVGENGLILGTENGGQSWNTQLIDTKRKLNGVFFINNQIGWVVGDNGIIARTSSAGVRWSILLSGITENLNSVFAVSQLIAWAAGDSGVILKTTNGITWVALNSGITANLNKIYFYDNLVGWAVGDGGAILKTTDGGSNWIRLHSTVSSNLNSVFFYDLNFGFAVGDSGVILRSSDGGLSWVNQSGNIYDGSGYISLSVDYTDVDMTPSLDEYVDGEEVSGQFNGTNKNCTVMNVPVTKGDGKGTTTNIPTDITVKVNGTAVLVDSLNGSTGQIILNQAPARCDIVKVYYYHMVPSGVFRGRAWISGKSGTVLRSDNIGAQWLQQDPKTSYDLNAIYFVNESIGWTVGNFSIIRNSQNGGTLWSTQNSAVLVRETQRVYNEGNVGTVIYLNDDSMHPDLNIETTKRVQVQYRIRVVNDVDPFNYPEAGLGSSAIVGLGPNSTSTYSYENMGAVTGDYGLWRSKCANTVDGYCWAIPMFFANRRNSSGYDPLTNTNGSHIKNTAFIRPDLLTSENVIESDILDTRRKVVIPSILELLTKNMESLLQNSLRTRLYRDTFGGDKYGTQLLQLDRIGGTAANGGSPLSGVTLSDAVAGQISSSITLETMVNTVAAGTTIPIPIVMGPVSGVFHQNPVYYKAVYDSPGTVFNGKPVPGYFSDMGTRTVTFTFGATANTQIEDPLLINYIITAVWINTDTVSLTHIPSEPKLVKNFSGSGSPAFFYHGVFEDSLGSVTEQWDSGISGRMNYAVAYPGTDVSTAQSVRASSVELHYFLKLTADNIEGLNNLVFEKNIYPDVNDVPYSIYTVTKINNVDSGFSYKISNIAVTDKVRVESLSGFPFIEGTTLEIIASVLSGTGNANVRNGATVNFVSSQQKIDTFCKSVLLTGELEALQTSLTITTADGVILGVSATEAGTSLTQPICWVTNALDPVMYLVTVSGLGTATITIQFYSDPPFFSLPSSGTVTIQALIKQSSLLYQQDTTLYDGLLIGYFYTPFQSVSELPTNLIVEAVTKPINLSISNLGTGGSLLGKYPYDHPLTNIPVNDLDVISDNQFYNVDPMRFSNISIDTGFIQIPVYIPGTFGDYCTLSGKIQDSLGRVFYSVCSQSFRFSSEGLIIGAPRKIFMGLIARVLSSSDQRFLRGEYIMVVISRNALMETENWSGYEVNSKSVIAVYRLPNKPMARI